MLKKNPKCIYSGKIPRRALQSENGLCMEYQSGDIGSNFRLDLRIV